MIGIAVANNAGARLRGFPDRLMARLADTMRTIGAMLEEQAATKLGGEVLRRRSGRLAGGLALEVSREDGGITAALAIRGVPYAAYQEYGFHGTESVRAQLRLIKRAFGRPITAREVAVRSYARRVDYPAHSYLRAALDDIAPDAIARIEAAVGDE